MSRPNQEQGTSNGDQPEKPQGGFKPCCIPVIVVIVIVAVASAVCSIWSRFNEPGYRCPDVVPNGRVVKVDSLLKARIDQAIQKKLLAPESYLRRAVLGSDLTAVSRQDGSEYYGRLEVDFRVKNAVGTTVEALGTVYLSESEEQGCFVTLAQVY